MSIRLLQPLAETGVAEAQFLLGYLFFTGANVSKPESRDWLERAASQDHPEATYWLACMGADCDFGPPDDDHGRRLLLRAAELGSPAAQRDLGCFYATGDSGFPKDQSSARNWYGLAAQQGHADAQYNYAFMLLLGEGGLADRERAYVSFRKAADAGKEEARRFLAENPYEKAEPGAAPNDGPATRLENSNTTEGPPSVS